MSKNESKAPATEQDIDDQATPKAKVDDGKVKIRPDTEKYTKARTAAGTQSFHNGDVIATGLSGLTVDEVKEIAVKITKDESLNDRYEKLNVGQQRMNLGNRIRGAIAKRNKENKAKIAQAKKDEKPEPTLKSGEEAFSGVVASYRKTADKRDAAATKERDEKAAKAELAKAAKAKKEDAKADPAKEEKAAS